MKQNKGYKSWLKRRKTRIVASILGCIAIASGVSFGIGYAIWHNNGEKQTPLFDFEFKDGYPTQLKKGTDDNSTIIILRLNGKASDDLKLEKDPDEIRNPLTHLMIDIKQLDDGIGEWEVEFNNEDLPSDMSLDFTIALKIINMNDDKYFSYASIDSFSPEVVDTSMYVPSEYWFIDNDKSITGVEYKLLERTMDDKWTTWLIPDTCNAFRTFNYSTIAMFSSISNLEFVKSNASLPFEFLSTAFADRMLREYNKSVRLVNCEKRFVKAIRQQAFSETSIQYFKFGELNSNIPIIENYAFKCSNLDYIDVDYSGNTPNIGALAFDSCGTQASNRKILGPGAEIFLERVQSTGQLMNWSVKT